MGCGGNGYCVDALTCAIIVQDGWVATGEFYRWCTQRVRIFYNRDIVDKGSMILTSLHLRLAAFQCQMCRLTDHGDKESMTLSMTSLCSLLEKCVSIASKFSVDYW